MTIDGNSIVNRAYYGIRQLSASDGTPTNAVYGFLTILQRLMDEETPDALCVTFDLPAPTFRHERYEGYKAKRTGMPDELAVQMPILKDVLDAMNIPRYELAGWEADDLLGALAKKCEAEGWECVIVTGDKDSFQLVTELTRVKHVKTRMGQTETKNYTADAFFEEYGFAPIKMIDLKALMGDTSDNIPGVAGVGEKTAMELVQRFGGIADIYDRLDTLDIKDNIKKKIEAGRESAEMSFDLARIRTNAPLGCDLKDNLIRDIDNDKLYEIFKRLGFTRLTEKFGLKQPSGAAPQTADKPDIIEITSSSDCAKLVADAQKAPCVALWIDTEYFDTAAVAFQGERKSYMIRKGATDGFDDALAKLLGGSVKKTGHDIKDIMRACQMRSMETDGWTFDTALAAYLAAPTDSNYAITRISERYCGYTPTPGNVAAGEDSGQLTMLGGSDSDKTAAYEAYAIMLLTDALGAKLKTEELDKLFYGIELPLCRVLADMEQVGFLVDRDALARYGEALSRGIAETEKQIYEQAGETFNINSPKQLGAVLFDKLMLPAPKKTKTGYSTNVDVLDHLLGKHPVIALIKDYRELSKLKSTYADGLLKVIGADGRIHTRFMMTVTATGRLSSTEPNLQNIPVRKELGGELRKMFVAADGNVLVDADYSQIELRILAHIAGDPVMRGAFESGEDIHTVTASQVFGVPISAVTSIQRSRAKAVNFGIVYGISPFSLGQDIGVSNREAKMYIESYLEKYSGVRAYMSEIVESAKKLGYVSTQFGRRRQLPELRSANSNTRSFGERVALNMPIQGTAADIMKIAMINTANRLRSEGMAGRLILQVHDELIAECPEREAAAVSRILREEMENAAQLSVPLVAETSAGKSWYDAK